MSEIHVHVFRPTEKHVAIRRYVKVKGGYSRDRMTAKDTLKQWECSCGQVQTYDLERQPA